ncbi:MAG: hypothetical protein COS84_08435 [Armatimonadetes bacterium CG07_land_8_20_14_0_80_40_9]|nr:MAG: hypothetical protein COS84_08435 [Armatimonadetes bacterium CG07_land_8_20_14_0_80_40_9]
MSIKILLNIDTRYDRELEAENIACKLVRIFGTIKFKTETGLSKEYKAIIDTGSPVSLIPKFIWQKTELEYLSDKEFSLGGISPKDAPLIFAKIANIKFLFIDPKNISPLFVAKAYLLPTDHIPLIIGFEDLLTTG